MIFFLSYCTTTRYINWCEKQCRFNILDARFEPLELFLKNIYFPNISEKHFHLLPWKTTDVTALLIIRRGAVACYGFAILGLHRSLASSCLWNSSKQGIVWRAAYFTLFHVLVLYVLYVLTWIIRKVKYKCFVLAFVHQERAHFIK